MPAQPGAQSAVDSVPNEPSVIRTLVGVLALIPLCTILVSCASVDHTPSVPIFSIPAAVEGESRSITPNDLISLRDIGSDHESAMSVSPDGARVAFQLQQADVETNRFRLAWFVAPTAPGLGQARLVGDGGNLIIEGEEIGRLNGSRLAMAAKWSPDSQWIAYRLKQNGEIQLWRSHRDGREQQQLTHNEANVTDFEWSADGERIYFSVGRSRGGMRLALETERERGFLFDDRFLLTYSTAPVFADGSQGDPFNQDHVVGLWVYDIKSGQERPATDADKEAYETLTAEITVPGVDEDRSIRQVAVLGPSSSFTWLENENPQEYAGYRPPLTVYAITNDGIERRCNAPECSGLIDRVVWNADGMEIYFVRFESVNRLGRGIYAWRPDTGTLRTILKSDDWIEHCDLGIDRLVCLHESATTPHKIVAIDPSDGSVETLVDPNPEFEQFTFTRVEKFEWQEASGADAAGHLVYPLGYEAGERYPLVIVQYRSQGFLRGGVGNEYPIHPLAANGYFVLSFDRPNNTHAAATVSDIFERERLDWGEALWERSVSLSALEIMVDTLDQRGLIDPARVGITGLSDGAETVWYAMIHSDRFAVAAVSGGGWSPSWYYLANSSLRRKLLKETQDLLPFGIDIGSDARWRRIAPEFHADTINTPILIQVSDHELVMSAPTIGALMDAEQPIESHVFLDEYHIKWQPKHKLAAYQRNIQWFNFWLRGIEDPEPLDPGQFDRWRALRDQHIENLRSDGESYRPPPAASTITQKHAL